MKKITDTFKIVVFTCAVLTVCNSCTKFLDVPPIDQLMESQVFQSEAGVNAALNGIYLSMAGSAMYGQNLTMGSADILGQYYGSGLIAYTPYTTFTYTDEGVQGNMQSTWTTTYSTLLNLNSFIVNLNNADFIAEDRKDILLGEAYGLRAFMHFDMLRLYGPVYSVDSLQQSIPYATQNEAIVYDLLPANQVMDSVLNDLARSEALLVNDPVRTLGVEEMQGDASSDFYRMRNRRFNYFAARALRARVALYRGERTTAYTLARSVIDEATAFFPWVVPTTIFISSAAPDLVFSPEVLFGMQNVDLYTTQRNLFAQEVNSGSLLVPVQTHLEAIYEGITGDYRYANWWVTPTQGTAYKVFTKYREITSTTVNYRYFQPLIRMSELYYIAAESTDNTTEALTLLNTVRANRGIIAQLAEGVDITSEILKEYRKEFPGEGQVFFAYKRLARTSIPNVTNGSTKTVALNQYVVPLPLEETESR